MTFNEFLSDIILVVVLYKKRISQSNSIASISKSTKTGNIVILVYDNSPEYNLVVPETITNCKIIYNADMQNSGVSKAYNYAASFAKKTGKKWIMLCDQDTTFNSGYLTSVFAAIVNFNPTLLAPYLYSNFNLVSPCGFVMNYGYPLKKEPPDGFQELSGISVLNSGLVISLEAYFNCGGYNEKVFLDFSDFDFIKKFKKKYGKIFLLNIHLEHNLGPSYTDSFNAYRFSRYVKSYRGAIQNLFDLLTITTIVCIRSIKQSLFYHSLLPFRLFLIGFILNKIPSNFESTT